MHYSIELIARKGFYAYGIFPEPTALAQKDLQRLFEICA
jgi:hypothetical protein